MRRVWRFAAWLGLASVTGVIGCAIRIPVDEPVWAIDRGPPESHDPVLTALANAIDPGPQKPLRAGMPAAWLVDLDLPTPGEDPRDAAEQELRVALLVWRESGANTGERAVLAGLARAVARAETLASTGPAHPELLVTLLAAYSAIAASEPDGLDTGLVDDAARRLLRHHAARLLRSHANHPGIPDVLAALADAATDEQDFRRAAELRQLAVLRLGERAGPESQLALAAACYRSLALQCGDAAFAVATAAATPDLQTAIDEVEWLGDQAHAAHSHRGDGIEARLERIGYLRALGRARDAEAGYVAAVTAAPDDARPHVGLAGLALLRGEPEAALVHLQRAHERTHRDRNYYELSIALLWPRLHETGAPRATALAELQALTPGYRRLEPARAEVLALLLTALAEQPTAPAGLPSLVGLARTHTQVAALVQRFPESADVRRLAYMTAQLAPTAEGALTLVREPLPPHLARDRALRDLQLETWFDLAIRWDRRGELPAIATAIAALPADAEAHGDLATTLAARAALAGEHAPAASREIYARISEAGTPQDRARALSNLAVLDADAGDPEAALTRWTAALAFDHAVNFIRLNVAGTMVRHESPPRAELLPLLTTLAKDAETSELQLLALAWRHALATKLPGNDSRERAAVAAAWKAARVARPGAPLPGLWGMVPGPPRVALTYSDDRVRGHDMGGLTLTAEVDRDYWLVLTPHGRELPKLP